MVKAIVDKGSLTRAAETLSVSQSALSHQLKKVEQQLDTAIFSRIGKGLKLTQAGTRIMQASQSILAELTHLEKDLSDFRTGESGTIRLSTECYTCYSWLPPVLKAFQDEYPKCSVKIVSDATRKPMQFLERSELDIAIVGDPYNSGQFESQELFSDEMLAVLSPDHPLAKKRILRPQDFEGETLVLYDVPDDDLFFMREMIKTNAIQLKQVMKLELTEAMIEVVAAGLGITIMANWVIADYLESKRLVTLPISKKPIERTWYATTRKAESNAAVARFMEFLKLWPQYVRV